MLLLIVEVDDSKWSLQSKTAFCPEDNEVNRSRMMILILIVLNSNITIKEKK